METIRILLGSKKKKGGANEDNYVDVALPVSQKPMPATEANVEISAYERYFQEKDASNKYRLAFTIQHGFGDYVSRGGLRLRSVYQL